MTPELSLLHVHGDAIGYGRLGVELAKALEAKGVDVYGHMVPPPGAPVSYADKQVHDGAREKKTRHVGWVSVPTHAKWWYEGQRPFIFTMWEATVIPPGFRHNIHEFETVIVPSQQNVEVFGEYHPNVHYVPLGVDPIKWRFQPRPEPARDFRFLIGGSGPRKGVDLAIEAFHLAFPEGSWGTGPIPRLICKSPKGEKVVHPRIEVISGRITSEEEVDLYASAHCYLQPSRGEGFGLQPLQAIAQGCPTILTGAHGHASFAHLGWPLSTMMSKADYFIYGDAGDWWEPSLDDLVEHMRAVYDDYPAACEKASVSSDIVARDFTWERTAERFIDALGGYEALSEPYDGDGSWYAPTSKEYLVRVREPWNAEMAGQHKRFEVGKDYWEPADTKRILFEAGKLDLSCLEGGDTGLLPAQVDAIGGYRAAFSHCASCGQPLNGQPTRSDRIFEQLEREAAEREAAA